MKRVKILSLFDGMACGMIAFKSLGYEVEEYNAYEIDKYAIKTAVHNFPEINQLGDVFCADFTKHENVDWLIGGSPCTYWSIAQTKNRETVASGLGWELFSQYVRALHEAKPKYFLYENNKSMSAAIRQSICEAFGFEPICINSALVSAQNRQRLYWVGIRQQDGTYKKADIEQPQDRGILLKDILITNNNTEALSDTAMQYMVREVKGGRNHFDFGYTYDTTKEKGPCVVTRVGTVPYGIVAEPITPMLCELESVKDKDAGIVGILDMAGNEQIKRVYGENGKAPTLTTMQGGHREPKVFTQVPPLRVKEATAQGYTDINAGGCVDMAMPNSKTRRGRNMETKANCLQTTNEFYEYCGTTEVPIYEVKDGFITIKGEQYPIKLIDGFYIIRKLTVIECMRLQTVPECYEFPVSKTQAFKMLGNGWTVEVIKHLITSVANEEEKETFKCNHCGEEAVKHDQDTDCLDMGISIDGVVRFYHCESCGAEIEYLIPDEKEEQEV